MQTPRVAKTLKGLKSRYGQLEEVSRKLVGDGLVALATKVAPRASVQRPPTQLDKLEKSCRQQAERERSPSGNKITWASIVVRQVHRPEDVRQMAERLVQSARREFPGSDPYHVAISLIREALEQQPQLKSDSRIAWEAQLQVMEKTCGASKPAATPAPTPAPTAKGTGEVKGWAKVKGGLTTIVMSRAARIAGTLLVGGAGTVGAASVTGVVEVDTPLTPAPVTQTEPSLESADISLNSGSKIQIRVENGKYKLTITEQPENGAER
jgi:hypothetical protein